MYGDCAYKKYKFGGTLIQPKYKYSKCRMKNRMFCKQSSRKSMCNIFRMITLLLSCFCSFSLFYVILFCGKDQPMCTWTHNAISFHRAPWRCWKLIIHVRVENIIAGECTREFSIYIFLRHVLCMCATQHEMGVCKHKMHNNNKWEQNICFFLPPFNRKFQHSRDLYISFQFLWVFILKYSFFVVALLGEYHLEGNNHIQYLHLWIILKDMQMFCISEISKQKKNKNKQDKVCVGGQNTIFYRCKLYGTDSEWKKIAAPVIYLNINSIKMQWKGRK